MLKYYLPGERAIELQSEKNPFYGVFCFFSLFLLFLCIRVGVGKIEKRERFWGWDFLGLRVLMEKMEKTEKTEETEEKI